MAEYVVSQAVKNQAKAQLNRLMRVEGEQDLVAVRFNRMLQKASRDALRKKNLIKIKPEEVEKVVDAGAKLAAGAYILELKHVQDASLQLSFLSDRAEAARKLKLNLGDLQSQFKTLTGRTLRRSIKRLSDSLNASIRSIVSGGFNKRDSYELLNERLGTLGLQTKDELPGVARTWLRTSASYATNAARWEGTQASPLVWGYTYVTMLDDRVREEHRKLEGHTRKKDDPVWQIIWPPNGWNCRCQVVALREKQRQTRYLKDPTQFVDPEFIFEPGTFSGVSFQ